MVSGVLVVVMLYMGCCGFVVIWGIRTVESL